MSHLTKRPKTKLSPFFKSHKRKLFHANVSDKRIEIRERLVWLSRYFSMSDRVTKILKPGAKSTNHADKQRERKRALDRKAQRVSREKTKSYIAHLENMLQILGGNEATPTTKLIEENTELHAEIDRLRKVIDSIKAILGVEAVEALTPVMY